MYYLPLLEIFRQMVFNFQLNICNRCQNLLMISINFDDIDTVNISSVNYCCIINRISEGKTINFHKERFFPHQGIFPKKIYFPKESIYIHTIFTISCINILT